MLASIILLQLFRSLDAAAGGAIYDAAGNAQLSDASHVNPDGSAERYVTLLDHAATTVFGDDTIAGGAEDDIIFGQLGDDTIQGDGSITLTVDGGATMSVEDFAGVGRDGDDYIEGNRGNDLIFGDLGQADIIGGRSSLVGRPTADRTRDGADTDGDRRRTSVRRREPEEAQRRSRCLIATARLTC